jgi:hypothetical protein
LITHSLTMFSDSDNDSDTIIDFFGDTQGMDKLPTEPRFKRARFREERGPELPMDKLDTARVMAEATPAQRQRICQAVATAKKHKPIDRGRIISNVLNGVKMTQSWWYGKDNLGKDQRSIDPNSIRAKLRTSTPDQRQRIRSALRHNKNPQVDMIDILYENEGGLRRFVEIFGFNNSELARQIRARLNMHEAATSLTLLSTK